MPRRISPFDSASVFAILDRNEPRQLIQVLLQQRLQLEEILHAIGRRHAAPR
jgi:hypothetical protein